MIPIIWEGAIIAEEAYYFSFDSLLLVEEYGLKAAALATLKTRSSIILQ